MADQINQEIFKEAFFSVKKQIEDQCQALSFLLLDKNNDYGDSIFRAPVLMPECSVETAIAVRMSDKIARLANLTKADHTKAVAESLDDTLRDLAGYCVLWLVHRRRESLFDQKDDPSET